MSRSIRVIIDGITFDSKAEARRYQELCLLQAAGEISDLQVHTRYLLQEGFDTVTGERVRPMYYTDDFSYDEAGRRIVEDVKSPASKTQAYQMRKKLFQFRYRTMEFREVEG